MTKTYKIMYAIFAPLVRLIYRIKTVDEAKMPPRGVLICANHTALADVLVLCAAVKTQQIRFMAKKELFSIPLLKGLISSLGAFPVDRRGMDVGALKRTIAFLKDGETVGIFPQGTRCPTVDPRTTEPKSGIGMIAYHSKTDVMPVYIRTKGNKVKLFHKTEIIFGDVIKNDEFGFTKGGNAEYESASRTVFARICEMSDEAKGLK